jgi:hypothetical protein
MIEKLKTLNVDIEKGVVEINGKKLSGVSYFKLEFDGTWTLTVTEEFRVHGTKKAPESSGAKVMA